MDNKDKLPWLLDAIEGRYAFDLILTAGLPCVVRIGDEWQSKPLPPPNDPYDLRLLNEPEPPQKSPGIRHHIFTQEEIVEVLAEYVAEDDLAAANAGELRTLCTNVGERRVRIRLIREHGGLAAYIHVLHPKIRSLQDLGMPPIVEKLTHEDRQAGIVLISGSRGSGRTATLAAMINHINLNRTRHIVSLEDPIEYTHSHKRSVVVQREVGKDVPSLAEGARQALYSEAEIVVIADIPDAATAEFAVRLVESGREVYAAVAARSVVDTIELMQIGQMPSELFRSRLSKTLRAVVNQRLVQRSNGPGFVCPQEILIATPEIRKIIADGAGDIHGEINKGSKAGMIAMDQAFRDFYVRGIISKETARKNMIDPKLLQEDQ